MCEPGGVGTRPPQGRERGAMERDLLERADRLLDRDAGQLVPEGDRAGVRYQDPRGEAVVQVLGLRSGQRLEQFVF